MLFLLSTASATEFSSLVDSSTITGYEPAPCRDSNYRNVLTVSAERSIARKDGDQAYIFERPKGRFQRQVHLGDGLDSNDITADYSNGVLTLKIPVSEQAQPRKISVGTSQGANDTKTVEIES